MAIYDLDTLAPGQLGAGPAVIESTTTTVLLRRGDRAHTTLLGWLDVERWVDIERAQASATIAAGAGSTSDPARGDHLTAAGSTPRTPCGRNWRR